MAKIKTNRSFTFKAYSIEIDVDTVDNKSGAQIKREQLSETRHSGDFVFKSECHYYVEKNVLDNIRIEPEAAEGTLYAIYKVSTAEDTDVDDVLVETIYVKNGEIFID